MNLIDFILNVAGVLLWLNWRSARLDPLTRLTPATLVGTIRRAEPVRLKRWHLLVLIGALIFVRALFYQSVGPAVNWTPKLDLGPVALAFRANRFPHELLFSTLSLLRTMVVFYFWLLMVAIVHRSTENPDPLLKLLLLQLGKPAAWPRWLQATVPIAVGAALWLMIYPLLARMELVNWASSNLHLAGQALLIGAGLYVSLKFVIPILLLLHLVASYVYLGSSPFWDFTHTTARHLLMPLNRLPLRFGKVDFAPVLGITLICVVLIYPLPELLQRLLDRYQLSIWPG
ncbi:MAG: hypothetical protein ACTHLW_16320 [Verrucomicrobiota bacterium]